MKKLTNIVNNNWAVDTAHSEIGFKIRHLMISNIRGTFKVFDASIYTTQNDFTTAQIDLWIDATSLNTGNEERDAHLKGPDFFDVVNFPQIFFVSNTISKPDKHGKHELWGDLTIKGIKKNIELCVYFGGLIDDPWGNQRAGFSVTGKINRKDWGLNWNTILEAGGLMVGDEIELNCDLELVDAAGKELTMELETTNDQATVF
ncbi:MAG: hypothetical protein RLY16_2249 [Bacteroidota bacterium]|jgi:polyisoprenoid-binding protein YceI